MFTKIKELIASKKGLVFLSALVVILLHGIGVPISEETAEQLVLLAAAYMTGQGIADAGKSIQKSRENQN
jgi:hypothetical protein